MQTLNIVRTIKKMSVMTSETLSLKVITNELDFLKKTVIIQ